MIEMEVETHRGSARRVTRLGGKKTVAAPDVISLPRPARRAGRACARVFAKDVGAEIADGPCPRPTRAVDWVRISRETFAIGGVDVLAFCYAIRSALDGVRHVVGVDVTP